MGSRHILFTTLAPLRQAHNILLDTKPSYILTPSLLFRNFCRSWRLACQVWRSTYLYTITRVRVDLIICKLPSCLRDRVICWFVTAMLELSRCIVQGWTGFCFSQRHRESNRNNAVAIPCSGLHLLWMGSKLYDLLYFVALTVIKDTSTWLLLVQKPAQSIMCSRGRLREHDSH